MSDYWDSHYWAMPVELKSQVFGIEPDDTNDVQMTKRFNYYYGNMLSAANYMKEIRDPNNTVKHDAGFVDHLYYSNWYGKMFVQKGHNFDVPKGQCRCDICSMIKRIEGQRQ